MVSDFNPYREWLGIESIAKPTYYQLLELSPQDADVVAVRSRARSQIEKLNAVETVEHAHLKAKLIARVERAAKILGDRKRRKKYDQQLGEVRKKKLAEREKLRTSNSIPAPTAKTRIAEEVGKKRRRSQASGLLYFLGGLCCAGLAFLFATQTDLGMLFVSDLDSPASNNDASALPVVVSTPPTSPPTDPAPGNSAEIPDANQTGIENQNPRESMPAATVPAEKTPAASNVSPEQLAILGGLMASAKVALSNQDIELAHSILGKAKPLAVRNEDIAKLSRLEMLTELVESYWQAATEGFRRLRVGNELQIDDKRMMIVERGEKVLVLRVAGRNETYYVDSLPSWLRTGLAEQWFDPNAASTKVFRGAMMSVTEGYGKSEVRSLWRDAADSGDVNIGDLELVLDDDYQLTE